jgi:hypothetical protein
MRRKSQPNPSTRENELAEARASLRESWRIAKETGLDKITDEEIDAEIAIVRTQRLARKRASTAQKLTANS